MNSAAHQHTYCSYSCLVVTYVALSTETRDSAIGGKSIAHEVLLPQWGTEMEEATILRWLKRNVKWSQKENLS